MAEDFWTRYQTLIDEQIRAATENGLFDDLPGAGRPLVLPARDDENWWAREKLRREGVSTEVMLPTGLRLRKEIERLPETVRELRDERAVREHVEDLNARVRRYVFTPTGPSVPVRPMVVEEVVAAWTAGRRRAREAAGRAAAERAAAAGARAPRRRPWWRPSRWPRSRRDPPPADARSGSGVRGR